MEKQVQRRVNRSAKTGKFVSAKKAAKKKATTTTETISKYQANKKNVVAFIDRVAAGQQGELKGQFICSVTKSAKLLLSRIK